MGGRICSGVSFRKSLFGKVGALIGNLPVICSLTLTDHSVEPGSGPKFGGSKIFLFKSLRKLHSSIELVETHLLIYFHAYIFKICPVTSKIVIRIVRHKKLKILNNSTSIQYFELIFCMWKCFDI